MEVRYRRRQFSNLLISYRSKYNLSVVYISKRCGMNRRSMIWYEDGYSIPSVTNFDSVIKAYYIEDVATAEEAYLTDLLSLEGDSRNITRLLMAIRFLIRVDSREFAKILRCTVDWFDRNDYPGRRLMDRLHSLFGIDIGDFNKPNKLSDSDIIKRAQECRDWYNNMTK